MPPPQAQDESRAAANKPVNEPSYVLLPGATRMPLIGLGTYKIESPESVRKALEGVSSVLLPCCCFSCCPFMLPFGGAQLFLRGCIVSGCCLLRHAVADSSVKCASTFAFCTQTWCGMLLWVAVGYRHIDCAKVYANEKLVGEGLHDFLAQVRRAQQGQAV